MQQKYLLKWISSDFFSKRANITYKISSQDIETKAKIMLAFWLFSGALGSFIRLNECNLCNPFCVTEVGGHLVTFILPYLLLLYFRNNSSISHWLEEKDENLIVQVYSFDSSFIRPLPLYFFACIPFNKDITRDFSAKIETKKGEEQKEQNKLIQLLE